MKLKWIMILGFVLLFAGCNNFLKKPVPSVNKKEMSFIESLSGKWVLEDNSWQMTFYSSHFTTAPLPGGEFKTYEFVIRKADSINKILLVQVKSEIISGETKETRVKTDYPARISLEDKKLVVVYRYNDPQKKNTSVWQRP